MARKTVKDAEILAAILEELGVDSIDDIATLSLDGTKIKITLPSNEETEETEEEESEESEEEETEEEEESEESEISQEEEPKKEKKKSEGPATKALKSRSQKKEPSLDDLSGMKDDKYFGNRDALFESTFTGE